MRFARRRFTVPAFALLGLCWSPGARAEQSIIKHPGDHPSYFFEAEPHLLVGLGGPFRHRGAFGAGFRGTFSILDNGFVRSINNSVGIGVGIDAVPHRGKLDDIVVPVVMQWNFWLSTHWSVFGEPGIAIGDGGVGPIISAGGRLHFTERIALTLRAGYPALSVGVSFFI